MKKFTLLELLVVIVLIAILVSILLPSLNRARRVSKYTVCFSQFQQFYRATNLYLKENDYQFPGHINSSDSHQGRSWIGQKGTNSIWPLEVTERPLNPYIGLERDGMEAQICKCPFNDDDLDAFYKVGSSYMGNEYRNWSGLGDIFLMQVNNPSKFVLSTEFGAIAFMWGENRQYWRQVHFRGQAKYPFLTLDGSTKHQKVQYREGINYESKIVLNRSYD